jgi:hypothetical protein
MKKTPGQYPGVRGEVKISSVIASFRSSCKFDEEANTELDAL